MEMVQISRAELERLSRLQCAARQLCASLADQVYEMNLLLNAAMPPEARWALAAMIDYAIDEHFILNAR